jgi:signal transduction histidine kinase
MRFSGTSTVDTPLLSRLSGRLTYRSATARVVLLVLGIGLIPLGVGAWIIGHESKQHADSSLDRALTDEVNQLTANLEGYFERSRSILLVAAQDAAFSDFYRLGGTRAQSALTEGPVMDEVEAELSYLGALYPSSIGEACFIDASGAEIARVVRGTVAAPADLSPDESVNPFFAPTFALAPGQVYQAAPYVSPDTGEWVISNSTLIPFEDGAKRAIVHFEVTIESFRRAAAAGAHELVVVDARSGKVVFDNLTPQRVGGPLGPLSDRRFRSLASSDVASGMLDVGGSRAAYRRLDTREGNVNDWYIVAVDDPAGGSSFAANVALFSFVAGVLLVLAVVIGRRWNRVNEDLASTRTRSEKELEASEKRYRALFERAEEARAELVVRNDQLLELDRLKDEFVALVSHELRTPLTSIRGYLELMIEQEAAEFTDEQNRYLGVVDRNSERLLRLVDDLLFIAHAEAGKLDLRIDALEIADVLDAAVQAAQPAARAKGISLALSLEGRASLAGDRARLGQLLDNLLSNAIKFTPPGGKVTVSSRLENGVVRLEVADDGPGMSEPESARLFERFYRTNSATRQAIPGTGLGLSIARAIVEAHGGTISCESAMGVGTTFIVTLAATADSSTPARAA